MRSDCDKRERGSEDRATAQVLQIIPHLHRRLHLSSPRALFPNKKQIQAIGCQSVKVSNSFHNHEIVVSDVGLDNISCNAF